MILCGGNQNANVANTRLSIGLALCGFPYRGYSAQPRTLLSVRTPWVCHHAVMLFAWGFSQKKSGGIAPNGNRTRDLWLIRPVPSPTGPPEPSRSAAPPRGGSTPPAQAWVDGTEACPGRRQSSHRGTNHPGQRDPVRTVALWVRVLLHQTAERAIRPVLRHHARQTWQPIATEKGLEGLADRGRGGAPVAQAVHDLRHVAHCGRAGKGPGGTSPRHPCGPDRRTAVRGAPPTRGCVRRDSPPRPVHGAANSARPRQGCSSDIERRRRRPNTGDRWGRDSVR